MLSSFEVVTVAVHKADGGGSLVCSKYGLAVPLLERVYFGGPLPGRRVFVPEESWVWLPVLLRYSRVGTYHSVVGQKYGILAMQNSS